MPLNSNRIERQACSNLKIVICLIHLTLVVAFTSFTSSQSYLQTHLLCFMPSNAFFFLSLQLPIPPLLFWYNVLAVLRVLRSVFRQDYYYQLIFKLLLRHSLCLPATNQSNRHHPLSIPKGVDLCSCHPINHRNSHKSISYLQTVDVQRAKCQERVFHIMEPIDLTKNSEW